MKKSLFVAGIAALALVACKKTETTDAAAANDSIEATTDSAVATIDSTAHAATDSVKVAADSAAVKVEAAK